MARMPRVNPEALSHAKVSAYTAVGFKFRPLEDGRRPERFGLTGLSGTEFKKFLDECEACVAVRLTGPACTPPIIVPAQVSFIVTARENTAMEALSWHRAHELHQSQFHPATSAAADTAPSTATTNGSSSVVDLRKYRRWLRFTEKANRRLEQAVVRYRRPTLRVKYEDFLERPTHTMRGVFAFLGLDPPPPDASAQQRAIFQKTNDGIPSHLVANHREWCELLRRRRRRYAQQGECPPAGWHRANGSGHG
eukprot:jgi/Tetstr1/456099/TSEL_042868.t1